MSPRQETASPPSTRDGLDKLREQYGCGPIQFTGTDDALYERHLIFDNVMEKKEVGAREEFEAFAHSVRDVFSQRWILTEETYERKNPKRVYYISMEFLIGRSLANNILNLSVGPLVERAVAEKGLDWLGLLEQEPDAGLGNGGLGRLAACFLDSMATLQLPAMGYGPRLHGHIAAPGHGLWTPLRIWHLPTGNPGWLAAGAARQLAASARPLGGASAA